MPGSLGRWRGRRQPRERGRGVVTTEPENLRSRVGLKAAKENGGAGGARFTKDGPTDSEWRFAVSPRLDLKIYLPQTLALYFQVYITKEARMMRGAVCLEWKGGSSLAPRARGRLDALACMTGYARGRAHHATNSSSQPKSGQLHPKRGRREWRQEKKRRGEAAKASKPVLRRFKLRISTTKSRLQRSGWLVLVAREALPGGWCTKHVKCMQLLAAILCKAAS